MREAAELLARYESRYRRELAVADVRVDLCTNSEPLARDLASYFAPWSGGAAGLRRWEVHALQGEHGVVAADLTPLPAKRGKPPKEAFREVVGGRVVLKVRTGLAFFIESARVTVVGDVAANRGQLVNLVCALFAQAYTERGHLLVHASAVRSPSGRGVAFLAPSGSGKTTMALAMLERGHSFVTNDRLLVRAWGDRADMVGVPKLPRANPGTLLRLPSLRGLVQERTELRQLGPAELWALEEKRDVDVRGVLGAQIAPRGTLHDLYVLRWSLGEKGLRIRRLDVHSAAEHLWRELRDGGVFDLRPQPRLAWRQHVAAIAAHLRTWEVSGGVDVEGLADLAVVACGQPAAGTPTA